MINTMVEERVKPGIVSPDRLNGQLWSLPIPVPIPHLGSFLQALLSLGEIKSHSERGCSADSLRLCSL